MFLACAKIENAGFLLWSWLNKPLDVRSFGGNQEEESHCVCVETFYYAMEETQDDIVLSFCWPICESRSEETYSPFIRASNYSI